MGDQIAETLKIIDRLKKLKAVKLRIQCTDGDAKLVPIPSGHKRWVELKRILAALEWVKIEACDARGGVLDVFQSGLEVDDFDEDFEHEDAKTARMLSVQGQLLKLMLHAQEVALDRQTGHVKAVLDSAVSLNRVLTERLLSMEKLYDAKIRAMEALRDAMEEGGENNGLMSDRFMEALAPVVAQKLGAKVLSGES